MIEQAELDFGNNNEDNKPVTVLSKTFANDEERRKYFREELRKKLPELKQIEGYPIGEDDDIIELSDPPYYTACPNPWLNDFVAQWEEEKIALEKAGKRKADFEVKVPYASDVSEGKNNPIYNAHAYHTKVPHPTIMRYILHYTQPGDIILDGFCGTGMTGVAAQMCENPDWDLQGKIETEFSIHKYGKPVWGKRNAILGDLSPIASFIAYNYNTQLDADEYHKNTTKYLDEIEKEFKWLYETKHTDGSLCKINYTVWSEVYICSECGSDIVIYDVAVDYDNAEIKKEFNCPCCGALQSKAKASKKFITVFDNALNKTVQQPEYRPVLIKYTLKNGKRASKRPDKYDLELIKKIENYNIDYWYPTDRSPEGKEARRNDKYGITNVHQYYTKRNLLALSALWDKLPLKYKCFVISFIAGRATIRNRYLFHKRSPNGEICGPLSGTLYIPSESVEQNVFDFLRSKTETVSWNTKNPVCINSASSVMIASNSIDYIFTDPPFGANIMYSELNFTQESWLKVKTNNEEEAIESDTQNKGLLEYQNLIQKCFSEYYRVLKPSKWITVEFSNTSAAVWNTIQLALNRSGFIISNVSSLDKKQGSINSRYTPTAVKQDLVISCYKPSEDFTKNFLIQDSNANAWSFIVEHLEHLDSPSLNGIEIKPVIERSPKVLYDRLITYFLMRNLPVPVDSADFQEGLRKRYKIEDGMVFTEEQYLKYLDLKKKNKDKFPVQFKLFVDIIENESDAIQWIKERIKDNPLKYQDIQPDYRKAYAVNRKGEIEIELRDILEENFIENEDHTWRIPNLEEQKDREILRTKSLLKTWNEYVLAIEKNGKKLKDVRLEALRAGFKNCIDKKDYQTVVKVGDKIPENILTEDEMLLNYYDIAGNKI